MHFSSLANIVQVQCRIETSSRAIITIEIRIWSGRL